MPRAGRSSRWYARRQWHRRFVLCRVIQVDGFGRVLVVLQTLETRWSDSQRKRLWRVVQ